MIGSAFLFRAAVALARLPESSPDITDLPVSGNAGWSICCHSFHPRLTSMLVFTLVFGPGFECRG